MGKTVQPFTIHEGLAVYRIGSGKPTLFMPGPHRFQRPGMRSADAIIAGLNHLDRQVITYDPPGSGFSPRPENLGMTEMHDCADEALAVCNISTPVDAIGHSMGGFALLAYALENPSQVRSMVLIGTGSGQPSYMQAKGALWNPSHPGFYPFVAVSLLHIVWPFLGPQKWMNNLIDYHSFQDKSNCERNEISLRDWFQPRSGRTNWHRIAVKLDYSQRLVEIRVPTLILCGRHDPQFPADCSLGLASGIPHARLLWFERSGHYPFIEEYDLFWQSVADFLSDCTE
jgi:proline iminopeptidase